MMRLRKLFLVSLCFASTAVASDNVYVTVAPLVELQENIASDFPANVVPIERSLLAAGISAEITAISLRPGDEVVKGSTIIRLDCRDTKLHRDLAAQDLKQAEVQLKFSERQSARIAKLAETNIASEELKDTRATELQQAVIGLASKRLSLKEANLQVSKCEVKAPFDAIIVEQLASVGTRVSVGNPILEIVSKAFDIRARIPFDYVADIQQNVSFIVQNREIPVKILAESGAVDTGTGTRLLRFKSVEIIDPGVPGVLRIRSKKMVVPADFLVERDRTYGIMVANGGLAKFITRTNATLGQPVDVTDLDPGTLLIDEGRFKAREGDQLVIRQ